MIGLRLQPESRLSILRGEDKFRSWSSLDDYRVCVLCKKKVTGSQIEITGDGEGKYELHCPTGGCNSRPHQWIYPANSLMSDVVYQDWWRALGEEDKPPLTELATPPKRDQL